MNNNLCHDACNRWCVVDVAFVRKSAATAAQMADIRDTVSQEEEKSLGPLTFHHLRNIKINDNDIPSSHLHSHDRLFGRGYPVGKRILNPIARLLLIAVYDDNHPLSIFRGMRYLIQSIYEMSRGYLEFIDDSYGFKEVQYPAYVSYSYRPAQKAEVTFPEPMGLNINMMPFIMSSDFENSKLPQYLKVYFRRIVPHILSLNQGEKDKIGFLTIQESMVEKGKCQRRPGLHVECPGLCLSDIDPKRIDEMAMLCVSTFCEFCNFCTFCKSSRCAMIQSAFLFHLKR